MDTRVKSAGRLKTAIEHIELNKTNGYFERSGASIKTLVEKTNNLTQAINVLDQNNIDAGNCTLTRKVPVRLWGTREIKKEVSIRDANNEIRTVVEDPVVVAGLRSLGIIPQPKAPLFTMPERPSAKTVAKAAGFTAAAAGVIVAAYNAKSHFVKNAYKFISFPGYEDAKKFVNQSIEAAAKRMGFGGEEFAGYNKFALGVGAAAIVTVGAGIAIYKHQKNKQAQAEAESDVAQADIIEIEDQLAEPKAASRTWLKAAAVGTVLAGATVGGLVLANRVPYFAGEVPGAKQVYEFITKTVPTHFNDTVKGAINSWNNFFWMPECQQEILEKCKKDLT